MGVSNDLGAYLARCDLVAILRGIRPDEAVAVADLETLTAIYADIIRRVSQM